MAVKKFSGVFAALLAPRKADDSVDVPALTRLVRFLLSKGVDSFALNGATGELCLARPQHLRAMVKTVREASNGKAKMLCGIGGPSISTVRLQKRRVRADCSCLCRITIVISSTIWTHSAGRSRNKRPCQYSCTICRSSVPGSNHRQFASSSPTYQMLSASKTRVVRWISYVT